MGENKMENNLKSFAVGASALGLLWLVVSCTADEPEPEPEPEPTEQAMPPAPDEGLSSEAEIDLHNAGLDFLTELRGAVDRPETIRFQRANAGWSGAIYLCVEYSFENASGAAQSVTATMFNGHRRESWVESLCEMENAVEMADGLNKANDLYGGEG